MIPFQSKATRLLSALYLRHLTDFIVYAVHKLELSVDEVAIISLVAAENTRSLIDDTNLAFEFGRENDALPTELRRPVSLRFIYSSLGMNRETARRRLNAIVARNLLLKVKGGFVFPPQTGTSDYTSDLRAFVFEKLDDMVAKAAQLRSR